MFTVLEAGFGRGGRHSSGRGSSEDREINLSTFTTAQLIEHMRSYGDRNENCIEVTVNRKAQLKTVGSKQVYPIINMGQINVSRY